MNIKNIVAILAVMFLHLSAQAQVIKEIQDSSDALTTVVIKEKDESDIDILNEQFDLEEMGMHQVVRITTGGKVVADEPTSQITEQSPTVVPVKNLAPVEQEVILANVIQKKEVPQQKQVVQETATKSTSEVNTDKSTATEKKYSPKKTQRRQAFKPYYDKRRFKKKKRKKRSRRSKRKGHCYRF